MPIYASPAVWFFKKKKKKIPVKDVGILHRCTLSNNDNISSVTPQTSETHCFGMDMLYDAPILCSLQRSYCVTHFGHWYWLLARMLCWAPISDKWQGEPAALSSGEQTIISLQRDIWWLPCNHFCTHPQNHIVLVLQMFLIKRRLKGRQEQWLCNLWPEKAVQIPQVCVNLEK